jgi:outer membrane receptor for ferrienterochelin and colicins
MPLRVLSRLCIAWLSALILAVPAWAQTGTITGIVRSTETGAPLVVVVVQLSDAGGNRAGSSLTNQTGRYQISVVPAGTYSITASSTGYATGRVDNVQVGAGQTVTVNLDLTAQTITLDPVVISASRQQERALDAPARVEVVAGPQIEVRPAVTPADHLRSIPGVDIATAGVMSTTVVARGFNNAFSGALYLLSDHRIAGVPSLRVNLLHFVPTTNEDLESREVVLGPGSALYGPNTANGVLHMLSRSPLTSQGTTLSLAGGERSLFHGTFRTAHVLGENFGFKVSGQYLQAEEWEYVDPVEQTQAANFSGSSAAFFRQDLIRSAGISEAEADIRIGRIGDRDNDVQRWGGEVRADWRLGSDFTTVFSVGTNVTSGIELTGLGAGQAEDWRTTFYQVRANSGRAFAQAYLNTSDAGETFLLRNGYPISDESKLYVGQLQHGVDLWAGRQSFTYGVDYLHTAPDTEGTINGIYEEDDETTEIGGYLQSETELGSLFELVLAGRVDSHTGLPDPVFSPRAAIVFKPSQNQTLRLSLNRAFSTPTSLTQFLDLGSPSPVERAARLGYSLRIQGTSDRGFDLTQDDGSFLMRTPFNPAGSAALVPAASAQAFWPGVTQGVAAGAAAAGQPLPPALIAFLAAQNASTIGLDYEFALRPESRADFSSLVLPDIEPVRESTTNSIEAGYKGILGGRLLLAADVWWSRRENLVTPLTIATPFVQYDSTSVHAFLAPRLTGFFTAAAIAQGVPASAAPAVGAQQSAIYTPILAEIYSLVPVGVVSSADVNANSAQLLMTYYNVPQDIDLYGTDLSASAILMDNLSLDLSVSLVNKDVFLTDEGMRVTLNAPKRKGSAALIYNNQSNGLYGEARARYNASYPVDTGVFQGVECLGDTGSQVEACVDSYTLLDLTAGYRIPGVTGATVQLSVTNALDEDYRSFPGVPNIGRMALLRLRYEM